jgi:hypothetical protein
MRRLVAALVMAALAVLLVACGADTTATNTTVPVTSVVVTGAVVGSRTASEGTDTLSPVQIADGSQFPNRIDETPDVVLTDLTNHMPMMIYFYDASQAITTRQNTENEAAIAKYRGTLDYLSFNINAGIPGSGSSEDTQTRKAALAAANLKVSFTPYIVFVDGYGRVVFKFSGFTDRKLLEREILRATGQ